MTSKIYNSILSDIVAARGLQTRGFRKALRAMAAAEAAAIIASGEDLEGATAKEVEDDLFGHYFNNPTVRPAAFKLESDERWDHGHLHVYEIAISARVPDWKIAQYGNIADSDGPLCTLHIFDQAAKETILGNDALAPFAFLNAYGSDRCWELARANAVDGPGVSVIHNIQATIHTTKPEERAILRAVYEMGLFQPGDLK